MPDISIVVPSFNKAPFLLECLDSLRKQTLKNLEIVVVDDRSSDGSADEVERLMSEDVRIRLIRNSENYGTLISRKTGMLASRGKYVMLVDQDDSLEPYACERLLAEEAREEVDILHFGVRVHANSRFATSAVDGMTRFMNPPVRSLEGSDILLHAFSGMEGGGFDWNVHHKLYRGDFARSALEGIEDERLTRPDDAYLSFALAFHAQSYRALGDAPWYIYNLGRGVTLGSKMDLDAVADISQQDAKAFELSQDYANKYSSDESVEEICDAALRQLKTRLVEHSMNECADGFTGAEREEAYRVVMRYWDRLAVAGELMRFLRDEAYACFLNPDGKKLTKLQGRLSDVERLEPLEDVAASGKWADRYRSMREATVSHLEDAKCVLEKKERDKQSVRIFVSTHKDVALFDSKVLQPVQVGCALREWTYDWALHDDEGENISDQNARYCELTTQYWAWKNVDAEYYGFCHYRRYFDFADERHEENEWGEIVDGRIDEAAQRRYHLDDASIARAVEGYDVVTTEVKDLREFPGAASTPYDQYRVSERLHIADLERVVAILKDMHPDYAEDADAFLRGNFSCFCNMFVMRRELFRAYCAWLFPILERFCAETDFARYSVEATRTPGHLSERLFNIYLNHQQRTGANLRWKQVQCVHFEHPEREEGALGLPTLDTGGRRIVPVVFAADDAYVPMVTTTIHSMLKNADPSRYYDVVVLTSNISGEHQRKMREFLADRFDNVSLRFHDVSATIGRYDLSTSNEHISVETYYRFLIQRELPFYGKVLYLDSDLVIEGDVAELYDTELGDDLLAAVRDVDYLGNLNMHDGRRLAYTNKVLKMSDPYDYFQAGVLVLNTRAMRAAYTTRQWLEFASAPDFIYDDQDVLNAHCEGRVRYLDPSWNVMHDCGARVGNVFSYAPAKVYQEYLAARSHPCVRHYAGFEKPWNTVGCDWAEEYWRYARETPFYEDLLHVFLGGAAKRALERPMPPKAMSPKNPMRKVLDPLMPLGSHRREVAKAIGRKVRGLE